VKLFLDMNLSPTWVMVLEEAGFEALHWSKVGKPSAFYHEIFDWAVPDLIYEQCPRRESNPHLRFRKPDDPL
jgi:hypothetical protein